jgi:hypothetical protein
MDKEQLEHSLHIAFGPPQVPPKRKPSRNIKEALERLESEAKELEKAVRNGSDNSGVIADILKSLK